MTRPPTAATARKRSFRNKPRMRCMRGFSRASRATGYAAPARTGCCAGSLRRSHARPSLPERTAFRSRSARRAGTARSASGASVRLSSVRAWFPPSFRPRQSRPSAEAPATEEAGASLATGTSEEECAALAPIKPRNGASWPKEGRVWCGRGWRKNACGSRIDGPRGRALPASGAANEVMFFQDGEDDAERQRPAQYLRAGLAPAKWRVRRCRNRLYSLRSPSPADPGRVGMPGLGLR
jgi:hypothetical protein